MALSVSALQLGILKGVEKEPNIVLKIEGLGTVLGASPVTHFVRIGEPLLEIGDPETNPNAFYIGAFSLLNDQDNLITPNGTSTSIRQSLDIDKGQATSVSNLSIAIIDKGFATQLISPGVILDDILERKCLVYYGFNGSAFPDDYSVIFRGRITDVQMDTGKVTLQISSPDDQKRTNIFKKSEAKLTAPIDAVTTAIPIDDLTEFLQKIAGPAGTFDPAFQSFVRIDDEIIQYDTIVAGNLTGVVRGALTSLAAPHDADASVTAYYRLRENGVILALKMMASGIVDPDTLTALPYLVDQPITSINVGGDQRFDNALFFRDTNVLEVFGLTIGDWLNVSSGSSFGANNVMNKQILDIVRGDAGDFVIIDGVSFVDDAASPNMLASFTSQYNTLPDGVGLGADEIDVDEHIKVFRQFLSSIQYDFYIKEGIENAKDFLDMEIYLPMSSYPLPRKARASIGYHIGPIPGTEIQTFDQTNVKKPQNIKVKRSVNKNFFNEIVYKFDEDAVEDKFVSGVITISQTSKNRIKNSPNKTLTITSKGLRTIDSGASIAASQSLRKLKRYQFGAESFTFSVTLKDGFRVEIGDIVILDGTQLNISDIKEGIVGMKPRLLEIQDKQFQLKTGDIEFTAVDTNFDGAARYGLMSPSSILQSGISTTDFLIKPSFSKRFANFEYRKWQSLIGAALVIRTSNYATAYQTVLRSADSNQISVDALPVTPSAGMIMELAHYDSVNTTDVEKLVYVFMRNSAFADGKAQYFML